jgi:protein Tex
MNLHHIDQIGRQLQIPSDRVTAVADLLDAGATVPFISRYRKEVTGSLDEVAVTAIRDRLQQLKDLDRRRDTILKSLEEGGHMNDALKDAVMTAGTLTELEDIYLPYRPRRRTRATMAREKGLEPLAAAIFEQTGIDPAGLAAAYLDPDHSVSSVDEALAGARDIIAEWINEDAGARAEIRNLFIEKGVISSRVAIGKETDGAKYRDYFDWSEPVASAPSHRILAMRRGEAEDLLNLTIAPPEADAVALLVDRFVKTDTEDGHQIEMAAIDSYRRLLSRSMETDIRLFAKERADTEAIRIFAENLRQLLLSPPLGSKRVMGIDPGFRTGCKVVCLDRQGKLLHHDTVYPHLSEGKKRDAGHKIVSLCERFDVEAVAVGNGTAGRETETFLRALPLPEPLSVISVNESGASIYSASPVAREEFPNLDLTVRGAVSIGRRLMDPLSELVKIDPKSIGVGQYQHDVDGIRLRQALDDVVVSCVNAVGVDVNRASAQLLTYISGLGPGLAKNIVTYRDENGPFPSRAALKNVPRLGPKAFEQAAGFLRVTGGESPLDGSAVHPERYPIVDAMARDLSATVTDLLEDPRLRKKIDISRYVSDAVGIPTLRDILAELAKPGRDPRRQFDPVSFASGIERLEDLETGMQLPGVVTNITAFGAFVDIGVHQDGLVHISQLADRFVRNPSDVVGVNQKVSVTVLEIDIPRRRISLSMKTSPERSADPAPKRPVRKKKKKETAPTKPAPFNNPFADVFRKKSGR